MNAITKKQTPVARSIVGRLIVFILCWGYLTGCAAFELESITYQEALAQYQEKGGIENYRCVLFPTDKRYQALNTAQPIAIEIDEILFVKIDGAIHELQQSNIDETRTNYVLNDMSATLITVSQFNYSEYKESDDRHVDLTFEFTGKTRNYKTFGARCGI